ncbi:hypothetical protein ACFXAE_32200 [Streptomyces sp. NPDC059454]|uniref:effector-associated domain 2-containing protein n=1 Tax=Streptomyces sp. NPDC059454 TaxID=3346836 RepID=UPI0036BE0DD0
MTEPPLSFLRVRFDADRPTEWTADARVVLRSVPADIALLELTGPPAHVPVVHGPPRYAALPEADVTLPVTAVGFPRFKLRAETGSGRAAADGQLVRYRDSCHVDGKVAVLSNRREGTLEVVVPPPAGEVEPDRSPWEGMSGAALWSGGAVVGLIAAHHRSDGPGRLAAVRVERLYELLAPEELEVLRACAGLPERLGPPLSSFSSHSSGPPATLPAKPTMRELSDLVDVLVALPILRRPDGLDTVLDGVDPRIAAHRPRDSTLRLEIYGLVRTCLRYSGTFEQVMDSLRTWEQDSEEMRRVEVTLRQLSDAHR